MFQIKEILNDIVEYAFSGHEKLADYKRFYVEIVDKVLKSKHGDYDYRNHRIRVFNLYRPDALITATTIHELAHHIDTMNRGHSDHSSYFYDEFEKLLFAAIDMEILSIEQIMEANRDATYYNKICNIIKHYEPKISDYQNSKKFIVSNCYEIKNEIKNRGYKFNAINKTWEKNVPKEEIEEEQTFLNGLNAEYVIKNKGFIGFDKTNNVIIAGKGSYENKEALKSLGFKWQSKMTAWTLDIAEENAKSKLLELKSDFPDVQFKIGR